MTPEEREKRQAQIEAALREGRKLHATVSHGRKRAEGGGWVSLGHSSVLNPPMPYEEPWS